MRYILLFSFILMACQFPKDPENSLNKAKQDGLIVGIVSNPPHTAFKNGKPTGTEVTLINNFARAKGFKVKYIYGAESTLIPRLEKYNMHLIIGGFDKKTIWKEKAGLTTTYNNKNCFLIAKGENDLLYTLESYLLKHKQNGN